MDTCVSECIKLLYFLLILGSKFGSILVRRSSLRGSRCLCCAINARSSCGEATTLKCVVVWQVVLRSQAGSIMTVCARAVAGMSLVTEVVELNQIASFANRQRGDGVALQQP